MSASGPSLRDIHLPPVSWWPPAPGWWLLAALLLIVCAVVITSWMRHRRRLKPWIAARQELDVLDATHASDRDDARLIAGISRLLRRIALLIDPSVVASDGIVWRAFLQRIAPDAFDRKQLDALIDAPYRARVSIDTRALVAATRRWCEVASKHRNARETRQQAIIVAAPRTQTGAPP